MKHRIKYFFLFCFCFFMKEAFSQNNVGIGTTTPASDAVLELKSNNQGILVPRMSTAQRLAIVNPSNGLMVYDTNYNCFYYYNAPAITWNAMCAGPTAPTQKANVQIFTSQGVATLISSTTPITVNGLSITVILTDTATVVLSSNGNILAHDTNLDEYVQSIVQLYQNSVPITGTAQTNFWMGNGFCSGVIVPSLVWGTSTVIPALPPGTYLFELKAAITVSQFCNQSYFAAKNYDNKNQGIITAEVIY
jgi:hypothetical protein